MCINKAQFLFFKNLKENQSVAFAAENCMLQDSRSEHNACVSGLMLKGKCVSFGMSEGPNILKTKYNRICASR